MKIATMHRVTALSCPLEALFPKATWKKELTLICYSTTLDLFHGFGFMYLGSAAPHLVHKTGVLLSAA